MHHAYREKLNQISKKKEVEITRRKKFIAKLITRRSSLSKFHKSPRVTGLVRRITERIDSERKSIATGDQALYAFLLDSVPFLKAYERAKDKSDFLRCENITFEFQQKMNISPPCIDRLRAFKRRNMAVDTTICTHCGSSHIVNVMREARNVCVDCSTSSPYGIAEGIHGLTYEEKLRLPGPQYTYKPEQHFTDLLNQVEGFSTRSIPNALLEQLRENFRQYGIAPEDITPEDVRSVLKDVKLRIEDGRIAKGCKYYEDTFFLTRRLNPTYVPIKIPEYRKRIFKAMFREVYSLFHVNARKINPARKNFLSYPFTAFKFAEHNGWREYLPLFSLLKSREKLRTQDAILKLIFNDLNWTWRDTV